MQKLQWVIGLFQKHKDKLPDDLDSIDEIKAKAQDMMEEHGDKLDKLADKIPGVEDDKIIEQAKDALKK